MESEKLEAIIDRIRDITATDEYDMGFSPGATDEEILAFEQEQGVAFPKLVSQWLRFADGCYLFNKAITFYGVAHGLRVYVQDEGYVCIGVFNYGDEVCVKSDSEKIYLCGDSVLEYADFIDLLTLVMEIGEEINHVRD